MYLLADYHNMNDDTGTTDSLQSPLQRLLHSDQSLQELLTATSQTTTVTSEKPTRNTDLKSGGLEDSLTVLSIR